ncbi:hypothetical protein GCM10010300_76960 [Streptomyces olivaceoviridis]|uniref:hypothetical protein n=1 Tax=Streptomyces olivaceoviridis TaxID=1921 RepID=UPI0016767C9B|nr:hypothetical protein [Streptomyces olivaceoviridis]GGZ21856.1 hypothetical protein GCM10010300_76960 [Streptomyces olivaceoviridis]
MTDDNIQLTGDNAAHFFDRYPPRIARWLARICDEASAKAPASSFEWRRNVCELIRINLRDGIPEALGALDQLIAPPNPSIKYLEERYELLDRARSAEIEAGTSQAGPSTPEGQGVAATNNLAGSADTQAGTNDAQATASTGKTDAGSAPQSGETTVVVGAGCGGNRGADSAKDNTGIGHQGTLFIVHWSHFRASVPARQQKVMEEHKRLVEVRTTTDRQIAANNGDVKMLDLVAKASDALDDLVNKHRSETTIAGVLRAAGRTPETLGLTGEAVSWLDRELKAM